MGDDVACCVIVPTYWTRRRGARLGDRLLDVYDHPTPVDSDGMLPVLLRSLDDIRTDAKVVLLVATTEPAIEHEAEDRVRDIVDEFPGLDTMVFGPAELGSVHRRPPPTCT